MTPRLLEPHLALGRLQLSPDNAHHLARVLRAQPGDPLVLFDGRGLEAQGQLVSSAGSDCWVELTALSPVSRESPLPITVIQALCLGDKMDWVVQKATELGAARLVPVAAERSQLKLSGDRAIKRLDHWQRIAESAAAQSGRTQVPKVLPILGLSEALQEGLSGHPGRGWLLDPFAQASAGDAPLPEPGHGLALAVGPEAGWTDAEEALAERLGYWKVRLGPRILRTETAALALLSLLAVRLGEF